MPVCLYVIIVMICLHVSVLMPYVEVIFHSFTPLPSLFLRQWLLAVESAHGYRALRFDQKRRSFSIVNQEQAEAAEQASLRDSPAWRQITENNVRRHMMPNATRPTTRVRSRLSLTFAVAFLVTSLIIWSDAVAPQRKQFPARKIYDNVVCRLLLEVITTIANEENEQVVCEVLWRSSIEQSGNDALAKANATTLLYLDLDDSFIKANEHELVKGQLIVRIDGRQVVSQHFQGQGWVEVQLYARSNSVPSGSSSIPGLAVTKISPSSHEYRILHRKLKQRSRAQQDSGYSSLSRSVLLVQVNTSDEVTNVDDMAFERAFFASDEYSVASHWNECSAGRAIPLVPYDTINPVLSIRVEGTSASYNRTTLFLTAKAAVESKLGLGSGLDAAVDHVVFCVPPGLAGPTFLASGAVGSFWIVAKPQACNDAAVLLHELGHLYSLKHAGQGDDAYGDETSLMGHTAATETKPVRYRCFNGQNLWKLQWFTDLSLEVSLPSSTDSSTPSSTKVELATFMDVDKVKRDQAVVVKVLDLYLVYNRQKDYNTDTGDFPNMVTIVRELDTLHSSLLAGLDDSSDRNMFRYDSGGARTLTIQICDRVGGDAASADRFTVGIGFDEFPCSSVSRSGSPTATPTSSVNRIAITPHPTMRIPIQSPSQIMSALGTHEPTSTHAPSMRTSPPSPITITNTASPSIRTSIFDNVFQDEAVPSLSPTEEEVSQNNLTAAKPTSTPSAIPTLAIKQISRSSTPTLDQSQFEATQTSNFSSANSTTVNMNQPSAQTAPSSLPMVPTAYKLESKAPSIRVAIMTQAPFPPIQRDDTAPNYQNDKSRLSLTVSLSVSLITLVGLAIVCFRRNGQTGKAY